MLRGAAVLVLAVAALVATTQAASAMSPVYPADGYDYSPGEPAIFTPVGGQAGSMYDRACTAGFAIAGDDGFFLLAAQDCKRPGLTDTYDGNVRGDAGIFAHDFARRSTDPTFLLRMTDGNDAHQLVVDPTTGEMPGNGAIQGWMPSSEQAVGLLIGKMGISSGWTEGEILGTAPGRYGELLLCTDAPAAPGDIGGPVWRSDSAGLRALGTVVAISDQGGACYRPIQETLYQYGAYLPSFGPDQGRPSWGTFAPGMASYSGTLANVAPWRTIEHGEDWRE